MSASPSYAISENKIRDSGDLHKRDTENSSCIRVANGSDKQPILPLSLLCGLERFHL